MGDRVLAERGKVESRHRLLPARLVVKDVMAPALFSQGSGEEVERMPVSGLSSASGWSRPCTVPSVARPANAV